MPTSLEVASLMTPTAVCSPSCSLQQRAPAHSHTIKRLVPCSRGASTHRKVTRAGLFGWDPLISKEEQARRREEQEEVQRSVLQRRRRNSWQKDVTDRRAEVTRYSTDKEYKKKIDDERRKAKPKKEDPGLRGIIIPLPPFGDSDMDNGERFDLRSPWIDEGWSDPTDNPVKTFGRLFSGFAKRFGNKIEEVGQDWQGMELERRAQQAEKGKKKKEK